MPLVHAPTTPTHALHGASFTSLATPSRGSAETAVWQVELAPGAPATPHQLTRGEVLVVLAGRARITLGDESHAVGAGDVIIVPASTPFALAAEGDAPFRAICCMPVGGQAQLGEGEAFTPPWAI